MVGLENIKMKQLKQFSNLTISFAQAGSNVQWTFALLFTFYFLHFTSSAQDTIAFVQTLGNAGQTRILDIDITSDGGFVTIGSTRTWGGSDDDFYLVKTDSSGTVEWTRYIGSNSGDVGYSVEQTSDGGYILTGDCTSGNIGCQGNGSIFLIKTDSNGIVQWSEHFEVGGSVANRGRDVHQTADGGYIVTGSIDGPLGGLLDMVLLKTNSAGAIVWQKAFGGSGDDRGNEVQQTDDDGDGLQDDGYIVAGYTSSDGEGSWDFLLVKTDANGDTTWTATYGTSGQEKGFTVTQTDDDGDGFKDDGYIIGGVCCGIVTDWYGSRGEALVIKVSSTGVIEWQKNYDEIFTEFELYDVEQTSDGGFVLAGTYDASGNPEAMLFKVDATGSTIEWARTYGDGGFDDDYGRKVMTTASGRFLLAGLYDYFVGGLGLLVLTDSLGFVEAGACAANNSLTTLTVANASMIMNRGSDFTPAGLVLFTNTPSEGPAGNNGSYLCAEVSSCPSATTSSTDANCPSSDGAATVTPSGGTTPYTYLWDAVAGNQTTATATGLSAGTYNVTVSDAGACSLTETVTVNGVITAATSTAPDTCSQSNGTATVSPSSGTTPYTYQWDVSAGSQTTATATGLAAGSHNVTVTDNAGCTVTQSATVGTTGSVSATTSTTPDTCAQSNGTATANPTSGTSPYTYQWDVSAGSQTTQSATGLTAGSYNVTVTDNAGCSTSTLATVGSTGSVSATTSTTPDTCVQSNGTATANPSSGVTPYSYQWDASAGNQTNQTATGLSAGSYNITVTDNAGCTVIQSAIVGTTGSVSATTSTTPDTCAQSNGTATANPTSGTSPYTYQWDVSAGSQTTQSATGLTAGSYNVTVTDNAGCSTSTLATVGSTGSVSATTSTTPDTCVQSNGTATANPSSGVTPYSYQWDASAGNQTNQTATGLSAGSYNITVTDNAGCTVIQSAIVGTTGSVSATTSTTPDTCAQSNGTTTANPTSGTSPYTYQWDVSAGSQTTQTATGLAAGSYNVTVTDNAGCSTSTLATVGSTGSVSATTSSTDENCAQNDGTATANPTTGTSPYTYQWDVSAGSQTTQTATGLAAGTYNVTVTDVSGCSATVSATVSSATAISLSTAVTDVSTIGGSDGSIDLAVSGGASPYTYNWSNGSTTEDISGLTAGNYCVTVSDTASCQDTVCVTVNEPVCSSFTISSTVTDVSTSGGSDGSIDITVSGGTTPYSYNWDNAATTEDISGLTSGAYCVTVTDTNACDTSICLIVNEPGCSGFSVTVSTTDATTVGGSDGTATANPTGGTSPYSYLWDANASSQTTQTATGLAAGSYCVTVTDNSSCVASACGTVSEPNCTAFSATATSTDATTTGGSDGTATANSASGTSPYSYLWDTNAGNQTTQTATGLSAGNYCVTVTDSVGCSATACVAVNEPSCSGFSANATATNATTTGGSDGTATANPTGGTSPYSYQWDANAGSQTTQTATGLSAGNYCVTVTDSVNCQTTACTAVNDPGCAVTVSLTVTDVSVPNDSDGIIVATPSGGTTPYSYQWDANTGNQTTQTATGLAGGNYCVTVTDSAGCTAIACETVNDPGCPGFSADIQGTDVTLPGGSDGVATANPIGGTSPFTYQWDSNTGGQTTQTATGLSQGNYCVTITDGTGCLAVGCTQINEPSCNLTAIISVVNVTTPGGSNGAATVNTTGGTSPFTYLWDANTGSQITQTATGLSMGNYCVTVTDSTNCTATNCASIIEINCTNLLSDAGADTTITTGETITIGGSPTASGGIPAYAYDWSPVTSMDDPSSANPVISPTTTTTYIVVITDSAGCQSTDDITVTVTDPYYFVPNVFSPNGDGIHDMLFVEGKALENIRFTIYDRWGEKVFESNSLEVGWDGTYKGKEMNSTVFVYILEASLDGQTIKENGNITLVRY